MISARHTWKGKLFWGAFARLGCKWSFREVRIIGDVKTDPQKSVLLLGNHVSWWDGFWAIELNRRLLDKHFYVMMLERELRKRTFMRELGAYSVAPGSRDVLQSLDYTIDLLTEPQNLVLLFPQGKIHSLHQDTITFQPGVKRILKKAPPITQVLLYAAFIDYGEHPRPTLSIYLTEASRDEVEYDAFYARCLAQQREEWKR